MRMATYLVGVITAVMLTTLGAQTPPAPRPQTQAPQTQPPAPRPQTQPATPRPRPRPAGTHVVVRDVSGNPLGGVKVVTDNGWFAARPSGTEEIYKIYAESFSGQSHLRSIQQDAQKIVLQALAGRAPGS